MKTEIFNKRLCVPFSKMWKIGAIYKADKIEETADTWPTLISALEDGEKKLF